MTERHECTEASGVDRGDAKLPVSRQSVAAERGSPPSHSRHVGLLTRSPPLESVRPGA